MEKIKLIGIGMDGKNSITVEAKEAIEKADVLIGAARMLAPFEKKEKIETYLPEEILLQIKSQKDKDIAVLYSGDCGFYSGAKKLIPLLEENGYSYEIYSAVSSPVYLCNKVGIAWQDVCLCSLHGTNQYPIRKVKAHKKCFFLLGGEDSVSRLATTLVDYNLGDVKLTIGENLSTEQESIKRGAAKEFANEKNEKLCCVLVENEDAYEGISFGIKDEEWIRGNVPMTKAEVRAVVMSKLGVKKESVCWDIGCGTGSVSVEMALAAESGVIFAVDKKQEAIELTEHNKRKFGCDNVLVYQGNAANVIDCFDTPDVVFIGGSTGEMKTVIEAAKKRNPKVKIVITAVSLETLQEARTLLSVYDMEVDVTQLAVTKTNRVGNHTMLMAQNPIYIMESIS